MAKKTPASTPKKKTSTAKKIPANKATTKKTPAKKVTPQKTPDKTNAKKSPKAAAPKAPAAKQPTPQQTVKKSAVKKTTTKPKTAAKPAKKTATTEKVTAKKTAVKNAVAKKAPAKAAATAAPATTPAKPKVKGLNALRSRILGKSKAKSIAFSLDEVKAIAKSTKTKMDTSTAKKVEKKVDKTAEIEAKLAAAKPTHVAAASLADILGFNPTAGAKTTYNDPKKIPEKYRRYFKLLIQLRTHLTGQIDQHSEETLKRSSKDDTGDLSSYGQHMADAGTDTFDRDFALSLVSNEQEALSEIEAAIKRINNGTYGVGEDTGKQIDKERLLAVPFTRFSAEAQKNIERNRHHVRAQSGLMLDGEDTAPLRDPNNDDE
jgi:RNA polymerase-binding transcription factor DksA